MNQTLSGWKWSSTFLREKIPVGFFFYFTAFLRLIAAYLRNYSDFYWWTWENNWIQNGLNEYRGRCANISDLGANKDVLNYETSLPEHEFFSEYVGARKIGRYLGDFEHEKFWMSACKIFRSEKSAARKWSTYHPSKSASARCSCLFPRS